MNFSIVIPCYQQESYLPSCLGSLIGQLEEVDEVVVVIDTGYDVGFEVPLPGVKILRNSTRRGVSASRNTGVAATKNEWIKFLDADDLLAPFALNTFRQAMIPDRIQAVGGGLVKVLNGKIAGGGVTEFAGIARANPMLVSASFVRRSAFEQVGGFDERIQFEEDWDLWLKLRHKFGMTCFGRVFWPVCYYWIHEQERAAKVRDHNVEGMDVREYFKKEYGIDPIRA